MTNKELIEDILTENLETSKVYQKIIEKLDNKYEFDDIKLVIRKLWYMDNVIRFYINKNISIKGKVTNLIEQHKQKIPLIKICRIKDKKKDAPAVDHLYFFDERVDKRYVGFIIDSLDEEFWIYQMTSGKKQYILLSQEELDLEEYNIEGMQVEINDYSDIAHYSKLALKIPIIFVQSAQKRIIKIKNHEELFNLIKPLKLTEDKLMQYLFSLKLRNNKNKYFEHPRYFERLIISFLFSAKYDSSPYPLHLLIIGDPGIGKSKILECLFEKMQETNQITDGSCSTIKTLIPSFKGSTPKVGDLLQSSRIAFVDEFLRILMRIESEDREAILATMNPLLEHKRRRFGSGNSEMEGEMTAKMITATNPVYGSSSMPLLCKHIDKSFISRILVYYFDNEHTNKIRNKTEQDLQDNDFFIDYESWISIYDYLNSFQANLDYKELNEIFNITKKYFGKDIKDKEIQDTKDVYISRYRHHLNCLADGIVKLRCLLQEDKEFNMNEEDKDIIKDIWDKIISSWRIDIVDIDSQDMVYS